MPIDGSFEDEDLSSRQASFGNTQTVGMVLFLAALFMLFVSGLIGYVWIRTIGAKAPAAHTIDLPWELWISTVLVIGVSVALSFARKQIRNGRQQSFRNGLTAALALAIGFLTVQTPAMITLLAEHEQWRAKQMHLYGFIFFLVLLHALHVAGGMVILIQATIKAHQGGFEGGGVATIRNTTLYWHFLDVVWVVMFGVLLLMR
jgi:cytochrome c oxidase subunit 3